VRVYPATRSPSISSPSSESHSSFSGDSWDRLSEEDDIDPSESASRPPRHSRSRRHNTEAPPAPARRQPSRFVPQQEEEPSRHRSHRHRSSRHHAPEVHESRDRRGEHREPRRQPSDASSTDTLEYDDYPYGRHGAPTQHAQFPPTNAFRHGSGPIPPSHGGGYPPSMAPTQPGYVDPYQAQALVSRSQHEPFGFQSPSNPFAPGPQGPQGSQAHNNPFFPHGHANPADYFQADSQHPQMNQHHRPPGPSHRNSMYGPGAPSSIYSGTEMVPSPYGYAAMQGMPPGMQPGMQPGMPHMMGYPMPGSYGYPPSHHASPPPPPAAPTPAPAPAPAPVEEKKPEVKEVVKEVVVQDDAMLKKIEALQALIKQQDDERIAREQAIVAAAAAKKAKEEAEALQSQEIAAASAAAKAAAETAAAEAAKAAKEESDKKLAEAEAAKAELEKKQKELEEAVAKAAPVPDMLKAPIKFKDAVGRKFSFPWHLCKTWKGMESLIKQAFLHVDVIGAHVQEGHYDLMGPEGEIILPQVWDTMIKPDWEVSMHMWPIPETPKKEKKEKEKKEEKPDDPVDVFMAQQFAQMAANQAVNVEPVEVKKSKKDGKKAKRLSTPSAPPPPPMAAGPPAPPPVETLQFNSREEYDHYLATGQLPPMVMMDPVPDPPKTTKPKKKISGIAAWMAGAPVKPAKKDDEKLEMSASHSRNRSNSPSSHSLHIIPVTGGNALAKRRRSTAGSSWTSVSAPSSPPAKVVAAADQGACAVM
jgi:hypothetical protein